MRWIVLVVGLLSLITCSKREDNSIKGLSFKTLDGKIYKWEDLQGKVLIVDFWATWCQPCRKSLPELDAIYKEYNGKVVVIGFSKDDSEEEVKNFLEKEIKVSYPIAMSNQKLEKMFGGILGLPTSFLVDKDGKVVRRFLGYVPKEVLEENIKRLL
ncbi:MAG: TlpA disulfide reductase family protein [candidate division WOR-3 bacterium]